MKATINQFRKKADKYLDDSWLFLKPTDKLSDQTRKIIIQNNIDLDSLVVVHFKNLQDWFAIGLSGIHIFQEKELQFMSYDEIADAQIIKDFQQKNPKIAADTLKLTLINGSQFYLKCLDVGAVYSIYGLITWPLTI